MATASVEVVPNVPKEIPKVETPSFNEPVVEETTKPNIAIPTIINGEPKVSAFSLASIKQKKELAEAQKLVTKEAIQYPTESFTETDMLLQWNKFAMKLEEKGQMILNSLMTITTPKLEGTIIFYELPNEGSKIDFEKAKNELLGYLRGMLHNHDIEIQVLVNEKVETKRSLLSSQEKFNRLKEINPAIEDLKTTFGLDLIN